MFLGTRTHCASADMTVCGWGSDTLPPVWLCAARCWGQIALRSALTLATVMAPSERVQFSNSDCAGCFVFPQQL